MASITPALNSVQKQGEYTVHQAGPWVEKMARIGYAAKGIIYMIVGTLAVQAAFSRGGKTTNTQGALATIVHQPFGRFLLGLVGVGLAGYAIWRFVEAAIDADHEGNDTKGAVKRGGYVLSGISYGVLAYSALQLLSGRAHNNSANATQDWTAHLLAIPFGQILVGLIGIAVVGFGLMQIVQGYKSDFVEELKFDEIPQNQKAAVVASGRFGYIARGIVFAIMGGFFLEAALHANARQAKGLGSALDLLARQPYGPLLLGIVAAGLVLYGIFMLVEARYRRIDI